jgi:hypothetical protein
LSRHKLASFHFQFCEPLLHFIRSEQILNVRPVSLGFNGTIMNQKFLFVLLLCTVPVFAFAQYVEGDALKKDSIQKEQTSPSGRKTGFDPSRLVPGGNLAMNFGNPYFFDISPSLGYLVTESLLLGAGVTYIGWGQTIYNVKYRFNYYGGRLLARQKLFDNIYGNAEMDFLNSPYFTGRGNETGRKWTVSPLVGGSYVMPFGTRGGIQATLLYNLNYQQTYSPYTSALIWRIGFFL